MEVIWDTEKIYVDLPIASMTLGSLKSYLSSKTGILPEHMKLFVNGGLMKDDLAPLSAYQNFQSDDDPTHESDRRIRSSFWSGILSGVRRNQRPMMRIRMVGSAETRGVVSDRPGSHPTAPSDLRPRPTQALNSAPVVDESSLRSKIRALTEQTVQNTLPQVEQLEQEPNSLTESPLEQSSSSTPNAQATSNLFAGLSEMLLQTLLKLDGFEIEPEWTEARAARKEGVRAVQALLERLDEAKSQNKARTEL
ncbi:hypothetical protein CROQUDRAFT_662495 [Cronartium quercuum f. sp. fusiforme G11]|uniref:BAG domain-containing protein n=1 Tax=Cronartium quercuum f. sp. fusiforme G11 TaxID=708437 RepID=A0A9P6T8D8_9BASI|nr:hypothetical protein CROQUDRAFT_662495 [Cronartium quercuum f. sp. fusiforme G11]